MKSKKKKIVPLIGITGSFAGGKTTVARMFRRVGASLIDADKIYHQMIMPQSALYKKVVSAFGDKILGKNKQIDRKKLGEIVFAHRQKLKKLCQLTHPFVIKKIKAEILRLKKTKHCKVILIDAPLLIEAGLDKILDKLLVVKTSQKQQIARCRRQKGLATGEIIKRIKAQLPLGEKIKLADYCIDNNGMLNETQNQVKNIWRKLQKDIF